MPRSLPPEILDLIIDNLRKEPATLKACCVTSKLWIPRARRHLFTRIAFDTRRPPFESWMKTFPDPSDSPAHHVRILVMVLDTPLPTTADLWICAFHNVVSLQVESTSYVPVPLAFVPFHGLSPSLRSLHLGSKSSPPLSDAINLLCSFPLLEDISIHGFRHYEWDRWTVPPTSPRLTGSLKLYNIEGGLWAAAPLFLELPNGLHFTKIKLEFFHEAEFEPVADLVSECSATLESLDVADSSQGAFPSARVPDLSLTATLRAATINDFNRPFPK